MENSSNFVSIYIYITMERVRKKYLTKYIQDAQQRTPGGGMMPERQAVRVLGYTPVYLLADSMNLG